MLAAFAPSAAQIWRVKAATEVLPLVPVTAAITCGWRGKNFAAASAKARRASPTRMKATPSGSGTGGTRSAIMAAAPAASAGPTNRNPSSLEPAKATNRSPRLTVRLSALTPASSSAAKRASLTASTVRRSASFMRWSVVSPRRRKTGIPARMSARLILRRRPFVLLPCFKRRGNLGSLGNGAGRSVSPAVGAGQDQLVGRRQLEPWLKPEQRGDAADHGAADRHGVPSRRREAVGFRGPFRLVEHDQE